MTKLKGSAFDNLIKPSDTKGSSSMSENLDELEKEINNVMTDEEVERALGLIEKIRHEYENDDPSKVPALSNVNVGVSAIVQDALLNGHITNVTTSELSRSTTTEDDVIEISLDIEIARETVEHSLYEQ